MQWRSQNKERCFQVYKITPDLGSSGSKITGIDTKKLKEYEKNKRTPRHLPLWCKHKNSDRKTKI